MPTRLSAFVLAAAVSLVLTGCGGNDSPKVTDSALTARLTTAKAALDDAETINVELSTKSLPTGVTGLLSAKGQGNHDPAFKGKVKVITGGASLGADVVAVGGTVYAKTSFAPIYLTIDPATLKAPDPASLMDTTGGISDLMLKTTKLADAGKTRDGSTVLSSIKGTLPGSVVQSIVPSADAARSFTVTYRLDDKDHLRDATINGPFYPDSGSITYTVKVSTSATPVTITKP